MNDKTTTSGRGFAFIPSESNYCYNHLFVPFAKHPYFGDEDKHLENASLFCINVSERDY